MLEKTKANPPASRMRTARSWSMKNYLIVEIDCCFTKEIKSWSWQLKVLGGIMHIWGLFFSLFFFTLTSHDVVSCDVWLESFYLWSHQCHVIIFSLWKLIIIGNMVNWINSDNACVFFIKLEMQEKLIETDG